MSKNKIPKIDVFTILIAAYLINMFHFKNFVAVQQFVIWFLVGIYLLINNRFLFSVIKSNTSRNILKFHFLFLVGYIFFAIMPIIEGGRDFTYIKVIFSMFLLCMYYLVIVVRLQKKYPNRDLFELFVWVYIIVSCLYVVVTAIFVVFTNVKDSYLSFIELDDYTNKILSNPYYVTRVGWCGFSGYNSSLKCTASICFLLYFIYNGSYKKQNYILYFLIFVNLIGNMFYARTGLLISLVCIFLTFCMMFTNKKGLKKALFMFCIMVLLGIIGVVFIQNKLEESKSLQWAFEAIINLSNGDGLKMTSYDSLRKMYFMPSFTTFMLGDGKYMDGSGNFYMNTDVGFMRGILYFGILGMVFLYLWALYSIKQFRGAKNMVFLFSIALLGFELKGEAVYLLLPLFIIVGLLYRRSCLKDLNGHNKSLLEYKEE